LSVRSLLTVGRAHSLGGSGYLEVTIEGTECRCGG
jgi:hypothetical protein